MNRKLLIAAMGAALVCGGSSLAIAQNAPPPPASVAPAQRAPSNHMMQHRSGMHRHDMHGKHHWRGHDAHRRHGHRSPAMAVIGTMHRLERLYRMEGKTGQIQSMYRNVLQQTQNPQVRHFAYEHLARVQMQPKNTSAAISTLHKALDESLKQLNQRDRMHAKWRAKMKHNSKP